MLYSGGFFSKDDKARMAKIRDTSPDALSELSLSFDDRRLPEMLMRYIGRNYPEQLTDSLRQEWEEYRSTRLLDLEAGAGICMDDFFKRLNELAADESLSKAKQVMLQDLADYAQSIYPIG
jgi:exodeoxyribonuclease-1